MKDSSNKRQTGGREKERWGSKTRGGRREESQICRSLSLDFNGDVAYKSFVCAHLCVGVRK